MIMHSRADGGNTALLGAATAMEITRVSTANDELLARLAREGRAESFDCLVRRYADRVHAVCLRSTSDPEAAQDLTQATFVAAFDALPRYDSRRPFAPWLFGIAANHCRMWQRKRKRIPLTESSRKQDDDSPGLEAIPDSRPSPDVVVEEAEHHEAIRRAIAAMPQPYREVIVLRHVEDMLTRDIAQTLGLSLDAVAKRLTRGMQMLRERLEVLGVSAEGADG